MKKVMLGVNGFLGLVFGVAIVSAQDNFEASLSNVAQGLNTFFQSIYLTEANLTIFLLGALLWLVLFTVVRKVFHYEGVWGQVVASAVSIIMVILAFTVTPKEIWTGVALQYGAMGATLLTVIPFVIVLYFSVSVSQSLFVSRVIWVFYIVYYFIIFFYTWGTSTSNFWSWENLPYMGGVLMGIVVFFILPFIRKTKFKWELDSKEEAAVLDSDLRNLVRKTERRDADLRFS